MGRYYEDFNVGEEFRTDGRTLTEADLTTFLGFTRGFGPAHSDKEWVRKNTEYRDRIFPGICTLVVAGGLFLQMGVLSGTGILLGMGEAKFDAPVYPGDTLYCTIKVLDKRESRSKPGKGIITFNIAAHNQNNEAVAAYSRTVLVTRKPR